LRSIVLNLPFAMRTTLLGWLLAFLLTLTVAQAPASGEVVTISAPENGDVLQGILTITGSTTVSTFASGELQFSYNQNTPKTWFLIQSLDQPVSDGKLATWDTNSVTDGVYDLRLVVILKDGSQKEADVTGLRIRNYTPIETKTPTMTPVLPAATSEPTLTPTITPIPKTATPLPTNSAGLNASEFGLSLVQGGAVAFIVFALGGLYLGVKALFRK
jgi:hypothetical protein